MNGTGGPPTRRRRDFALRSRPGERAFTLDTTLGTRARRSSTELTVVEPPSTRERAARARSALSPYRATIFASRMPDRVAHGRRTTRLADDILPCARARPRRAGNGRAADRGGSNVPRNIQFRIVRRRMFDRYFRDPRTVCTSRQASGAYLQFLYAVYFNARVYFIFVFHPIYLF